MSENKMTQNKPSAPLRGPGPGGHGGGPAAAMMPGEKARDFKGTMRQLMTYLKRYVPAITVCLFLAAASTVFSIAGPKIMAGATNKLAEGLIAIVSGTGGMDYAGIGLILRWCAALYLLSSVLQYLQGHILAGIATKVSYTMRNQISDKMNLLPLAYFDRTSQGDVLSVVTNDVDTLTQTLNQSLPQIVSSVTTLAGVLVMMFSINVWMTLITLLVLPLSMVLVRAIIKKSQPYFSGQQRHLAEANGVVEEMYGAHQVVRAFNYEEQGRQNFEQVNEKLYKAAWKSQFFGGMMMPVMNFVTNLGYVAVVVMGGFFTLRGQMTVGEIQAFIQYVRSFTQPITQVANAANVLQQTAAAAERVFAFLAEEEEQADPAVPVEPRQACGSVYFAHVNFGYTKERTIIHDFSAMVEPGRKVAIVGPTGAGKTTIIKLLMRFYDVDSGAVLVDGYNLRQYTRSGLRSMFGMVLQDAWLYNDTILENIRYGRLDASDQEVEQAARDAQADHFIRTLPGGYSMVLNEEADNLSTGQKQLLTIARTFLADPQILILDEATSSVDTRTEIAIQKAMKRLMKGRTSFVIAHRLSTIRDADLILVMRDGDIVESGNHQMLLAQNGFYSQLYNSQFAKIS